MPVLAASDAERLLRFVADAEGIGGDQPFPPELLVELGKLVEADCVRYCELDRVRRRDLLALGRPGEEEDESDELGEIFWTVVIDEHPVCVRHQCGNFDALKLSDFVSGRQLRRTRLYDVWLRPLGVEHVLNVAIPSPLWHTKTFLFDRRPGSRDFTERDRLVLDLLQPHFARLWQAAKNRRLLRAALAELDQADENDSRGVVFLEPGAEVEFASPAARRLLRDFFQGGGRSRLPPALSEWLESDSGPLVRRRGPRELSVERTNGTLLLRERRVEVQLTGRESEVLAWVARGKTNAEIAERLWLAPGTVRKHLENVYAKLGVTTRTAAVARFLGLIDAEGS